MPTEPLCPERESNPQTLGFKPSRSAGWRIWAEVVPDGVEPSFPGCGPSVVAVGPRDRVFQVESPGVAPGSLACGASVVLLDHDPMFFPAEAVGLEPTSGRVCRRLPSKQVPHQFGWLPLSLFTKAEAVGLEPTSGFRPPPVFKTGLLIRPDGFRSRQSCGGWNRTNMKTFRASHPAVR